MEKLMSASEKVFAFLLFAAFIYALYTHIKKRRQAMKLRKGGGPYAPSNPDNKRKL